MRSLLAAAASLLATGCAILTGHAEHDLRSDPLISVGDPLADITLVDPDELALTDLESVRTSERPLVLVFGSFT